VKNKFTKQREVIYSHFKAIVLKRMRNLKRDYKGMLCEIFIPVVVVLIGCIISTINFWALQPTLILSPSFYSPQTLIYASNSSNVNSTKMSQVINNLQISN
jgi:ATP-binding cassette subfamily A (ABC1) protein 3